MGLFSSFKKIVKTAFRPDKLITSIFSGPDSPSVDSFDYSADTPSYEESGEPTSLAIREAEARKLRRKRGASGTILTSPLGTSNNSSSDSGILG